MKQIALLRGVNAGGKNKIKMEELSKLFVSIGFTQVQTYIQSGNIVYESGDDELTNARKIEKAIREGFGLEIPTFVISRKRLMRSLELNPFDALTHQASYLIFYFLSDMPKVGDIEVVHDGQGEKVILKEDVIYAYYPQGSGRSKLIIKLDHKKLGSNVTGRNLTTVEKLLQMSGDC
jgi:uncharacterized protein (DUF1697 family)